MGELDGWQQAGYFGSCYIYAKGNKRRLVNPKTGKITFEYEIVQINETKRGLKIKYISVDEENGEQPVL